MKLPEVCDQWSQDGASEQHDIKLHFDDITSQNESYFIKISVKKLEIFMNSLIWEYHPLKSCTVIGERQHIWNNKILDFHPKLF